MEEKIITLIGNLKFLQTSLALELKGEEMPESARKTRLVMRSALSTLKIMAKRHKVPELSILADNIYYNTSPKSTSNWRKALYFFLGFIIVASVVFLGGDSPFSDDDDDGSEERRKTKLAIVQLGSAVKILENLRKKGHTEWAE